MAIYSLNVEMIKRSKGHSAVAAAAYRAGEKINNWQRGTEEDYSRKSDVAYKKIFLPKGVDEKFLDREYLWNTAEQAEGRKDAQLAREIKVALPHELDSKQQIALLEKFVTEIFVSDGMIADVALHRPRKKKKQKKQGEEDKKDGEQENDHFHILLHTRRVQGLTIFEKAREWNGNKPIKRWREQWAKYANEALKEAGLNERIDHRSYAEQGIDLEPTIHEGRAAREMEKRGEVSELCEINRQIRARNAEKKRRNQNASNHENQSTRRSGKIGRSSERRSEKNIVRFTAQSNVGGFERNRGRNFESFGQKRYLPDMPFFNVAPEEKRDSMLLPSVERSSLEIDRADRVRDLHMLGPESNRGLNRKPQKTKIASTRIQNIGPMPKKFFEPELENLYRITPLILGVFNRDKAEQILAPSFKKFGIEDFELRDYMLKIEVVSDRQKRGEEPEPLKPNASAYQKIGTVNFISPLTNKEESVLGSILSDPALPVPEKFRGEGEDWSGLTPSARLEKMMEHRFDEDYDL